ncbi:MAG TPA: amidohydrolase [Ruminiclostridium sp.]|nr:amidohydrolase family protein [Clostridiaceae bacterium]HAA26240.1 amidohydrolase [Ruminiclostridium sp.]
MLIINARIISMADRTKQREDLTNIAAFENGYIHIEGSIIKEMGSMANCPNDTDILDAKGRYVLPGFVDAHTHIGLFEDSVGFEGDDGNEAIDPVTPQLRAIDGIYHADRAFDEARQWGVTTVVCGPGSSNVICGQFAALKTWGRSVDEMIIKQPCALKVAFGENPKSVHNDKNRMPSTRMTTAAILREQLYKAKEYMDNWGEYRKNPDEKDKPEFDIRLEALIPVLKRELIMKVHAHRADDILTALRIAEEFNLDITIDHCTEGHMIADILKQKNVKVILGPLLTDRSKIELRNQSIEAPGILSKEGIPVAIMTDHPAVPIQHLLLSASVAVREGMEEEDALKAITINAAKAAGIDDRVGSLEPGKDADIVIFSGYPFDYKTKVDITIINGKVVYRRL